MGLFDLFRRKLMPRNGVVTHYFHNDPSKGVQSRGNYLNDQEDGEWIYNHNNGTLMAIGTYVLGKKEGEWREFDDYGRLIQVANFQTGFLQGQFKSIDYSYDGVRFEVTGNYVMALKEGFWAKTYYRDHNTIRKGPVQIEFGNYEHDVKTGKWQELSLAFLRQSILEGVYVAGKRDGDWEYYSSSGNLSEFPHTKATVLPHMIEKYVEGVLITKIIKFLE